MSKEEGKKHSDDKRETNENDDVDYKYDFQRKYKDLNYNLSELGDLERLAQQLGPKATDDIRESLEKECGVGNKLHRMHIATQIIDKQWNNKDNNQNQGLSKIDELSNKIDNLRTDVKKLSNRYRPDPWRAVSRKSHNTNNRDEKLANKCYNYYYGVPKNRLNFVRCMVCGCSSNSKYRMDLHCAHLVPSESTTIFGNMMIENPRNTLLLCGHCEDWYDFKWYTILPENLLQKDSKLLVYPLNPRLIDPNGIELPEKRQQQGFEDTKCFYAKSRNSNNPFAFELLFPRRIQGPDENITPRPYLTVLGEHAELAIDEAKRQSWIDENHPLFPLDDTVADLMSSLSKGEDYMDEDDNKTGTSNNKFTNNKIPPKD